MTIVNDSVDGDQLRTDLAELYPRLRRFALGLSGSTHDADDLVQAGYERAFSRLSQWQQGTRLDSWMYRIIQNIHFNELRSARARHSHRCSASQRTHSAPDCGEVAIAQITLDRVRSCLQRLPQEQRACLLLVVVEGLSYAETASVLEVPVGTMTSRLARARTALRKMLEHGGVVR